MRIEYPPAGAKLTVVQKRSGRVIASARVPAANGAEACLKPLKVNDRIQLKQGGEVIRTSVVPKLSVSLDLPEDIVDISVPASNPDYGIAAYNQLAGYQVGSVFYDGTAQVSGGRARSTDDLTGSTLEDLGAGDEVSLTWFAPNEDAFRLNVAAPYVTLQEQPWKARGTARRGSSVTITLRRNGTVAGTIARTLPGEASRWSGTFRKAGEIAGADPGDKVVHSQLTAPALTVLDDIPLAVPDANGSISMTCFPNAPWVLLLNGSFRAGGITGANGAIAVTNLTNDGGDLTPSDVLDLGCETKAGFGGQRWTIRFGE